MTAVTTRWAPTALAAALIVAGSTGVALADGGAATSQTKKVASTVKIDEFTAGAAKGSVGSKKGVCENGRLVSLFHLNAATGNFELGAVVKTTRKGKFIAGATVIGGDLYAVAVGKKKIITTRVKDGRRIVRKTICKADTSEAQQA